MAKPKRKPPKGLYQKYNVTRVDGEQRPGDIYFVLRLNRRHKDDHWSAICRDAAAKLVEIIRNELDVVHEQLADDLERLLRQQEPEECDECSGSGSITCLTCDGSGEYDCEECGGGGCDECNDTGIGTCSSCGGSGEEECSYCDGTGEVESE